jgi:hypothetical protein
VISGVGDWGVAMMHDRVNLSRARSSTCGRLLVNEMTEGDDLDVHLVSRRVMIARAHRESIVRGSIDLVAIAGLTHCPNTVAGTWYIDMQRALTALKDCFERRRDRSSNSNSCSIVKQRQSHTSYTTPTASSY